MKHKFLVTCMAILFSYILVGCGEDPELSHFKNSIEDFCEKVADIDTSINNIDANAENAPDELLSYLDELNIVFQSFGRLDFPEEFDYLEPIADEASSYMTEAVKSYHDTYKDNNYNQYSADYAAQNYARTYKRVQIILDFLQGKTPDDAELSIEYTE